MSLKIIETALPILSECLRPEHMLGFIKGMCLVHLHKDLHAESGQERDRELLKWVERRDGYIAGQQAVGEPDGLPVPPVYWTDELQGYDDREELIACMPCGCVFSLHSSVEPHMEWVARMPIGDGEWETQTFKTQAAGEKALKDLREEHQREYEAMMEEVRRLYGLGDVAGAESRMEAWDSVNVEPLQDEPGIILVDGERIVIGGDLPKVPRPLEHHSV